MIMLKTTCCFYFTLFYVLFFVNSFQKNEPFLINSVPVVDNDFDSEDLLRLNISSDSNTDNLNTESSSDFPLKPDFIPLQESKTNDYKSKEETTTAQNQIMESWKSDGTRLYYPTSGHQRSHKYYPLDNAAPPSFRSSQYNRYASSCVQSPKNPKEECKTEDIKENNKELKKQKDLNIVGIDFIILKGDQRPIKQENWTKMFREMSLSKENVEKKHLEELKPGIHSVDECKVKDACLSIAAKLNHIEEKVQDPSRKTRKRKRNHIVRFSKAFVGNTKYGKPCIRNENNLYEF